MLTKNERNRPREADRLVREYFGGRERPLCGECGEELEFRTDYSIRDLLRLEIHCPGCGRRLDWRQTRSPGLWEPLHLIYFHERMVQGQAPRCPFDDSGVSVAEFEGGLLEFRCPFCNRRGRLDPLDPSARLHLNENENIVFLTV